MADTTQYQLDYAGADIASKLAKIDTISALISQMQGQIGKQGSYAGDFRPVKKLDGKTWTQSIQAYEDEASNLFKSTGFRTRLKFPENSVIEINTTIMKKSGVDWFGHCKIKRVSTDRSGIWALVSAVGQYTYNISELSFENLDQSIAMSYDQHWSTTAQNACIINHNCVDFTICDCTFTKYTSGIWLTGCRDFIIDRNILWSNVSGREYSQYLNDSYKYSAGAQTGDIVGWVDNKSTWYNDNFIITNNQCKSCGLRMGIEVLTQAATESRGIIANNYIQGVIHGIKVYKGTYGKLVNQVTNIRQTIIANNHISYCREAGIYIRANLGCLVTGNYLAYCGLYDTAQNGVGGAAFGGILTRVSAEMTDPNSSLEAGNMIIGNYVYNCGKPKASSNKYSAVAPQSIQIRNARCTVIGNYIVQDSDWTKKTGFGIMVGDADNVEGCVCQNNHIVNFDRGIQVANAYTSGDYLLTFSQNIIENCNIGMNFWNSSGASTMIFDNNKVSNCTVGCYAASCKNPVVKDNYYFKCTTGTNMNATNCFHVNNFYRSCTTPLAGAANCKVNTGTITC